MILFSGKSKIKIKRSNLLLIGIGVLRVLCGRKLQELKMSYIQHREMRFPLLRHTCRVWATRYPFIQNIIYIKTTDMGRNNVLVILHNAHAMINEDKLYQAFSDTIGQIGLKRTGSKEETEFLSDRCNK